MKKKNLTLVYAIVGVLTLIVAVAGSTYAYYVASATNTDKIKGTAAGAGLSLSVKKLSTSASGNLIPLTNDVTTLTTAAKGYGNSGSTYDATKSCIDKNGYSVCQVYQIDVKNDSTASVVLSGGVTALTGSTTPNLACATMESSVSVTNNTSCKGTNTIANNVTFSAGQTKTYYIIVYINNLSSAQTDSGSFTGTVTFTSATGKLEATFS